MLLESIRINFKNRKRQELAALLERPKGPVVAYVLFAHCFTCSKDVFAASRIAKGLVENGIAMLRFDFTGLGHSEGILFDVFSPACLKAPGSRIRFRFSVELIT